MASRGWCFTLNNWTADEYKAVTEGGFDYLVVGREMGEQGTPHLQGYMYLKGRGRRLGGVKKLAGFARAHLEPAAGNAEQNFLYCSKGGDFVEMGVRPVGQGKRKDIDVVRDIINAGGGMGDVLAACQSYQAARMGELLLKYARPQARDVEVIWLHGPSGCGKTRLAVQMCDEAKMPYWMSSRSLKWWDGYDGEEAVIVDDYRTDFCSWSELLRILDRYPFRVEVKGGSRPLCARVIIITSPRGPLETWAGQTDEEMAQLTRRITRVTQVVPEVRGVILGPPDLPP